MSHLCHAIPLHVEQIQFVKNGIMLVLAHVFLNILEILMSDVNLNVLPTLTVLEIRLASTTNAKILVQDFVDWMLDAKLWIISHLVVALMDSLVIHTRLVLNLLEIVRRKTLKYCWDNCNWALKNSRSCSCCSMYAFTLWTKLTMQSCWLSRCLFLHFGKCWNASKLSTRVCC